MATPKKAATNGEAPTQVDMVKAALASGEVEPRSNVAISDWIKAKYSIPLTPQQIAQVKVGFPKKKKGGRPKKDAAKPQTASVVVVSGDSSVISLEDVHAVKKLVDLIGAEKVQQLARVLAK
ncbi:MAG: hypothetical protein K2R98_26995 [Gemmataceae bacterium]|nr:hypothetical protein [Gemmataceae bacterium]